MIVITYDYKNELTHISNSLFESDKSKIITLPNTSFVFGDLLNIIDNETEYILYQFPRNAIVIKYTNFK